MIEPEISLAFSIQSKKGTFALLLGSGVSRAAGIPTGWEIVLDLIRRLAAAASEDCEPNPETWYIKNYNEEPNYSKILEHLTKSPTTRSQILKNYFEPDDEEREQDLKMPTQAHKSIANLVKEGYIKVILTTNFDRLMEHALENVGVIPTVISTPDSVKGVLPLSHTDCLVIKVHGDYLDTRIKNSPEELANYGPQLKKLLERILDEYGLVICGWSAEWDTALMAAFERCNNHRFQTFWTYRGELKENAKKLVSLRKAEEIKIKDADTFFRDLEEKIVSIQEFDKPHPLSAKTVIVTLKKLLRDDSQDIRLQEMLNEEIEKTYKKLSPLNFPVGQREAPFSEEEFIKRVKRYESLTEILLEMMIVGCYWGNSSRDNMWVKTLERIANPSGHREGYTYWINLRLYPALLLFYGGGIASIAAEKYQTFANLINRPKILLWGKEENILPHFIENQVIHFEIEKLLPDSNKDSPVSSYLLQLLREPLRDFLPSDIAYSRCFDRFEYFLALIHADYTLKASSETRIWVYPGIFLRRGYYVEEGTKFIPAQIEKDVENEIESYGNKFPLLSVGFFNGSIDRLRHVKLTLDSRIMRTRSFFR